MNWERGKTSVPGTKQASKWIYYSWDCTEMCSYFPSGICTKCDISLHEEEYGFCATAGLSDTNKQVKVTSSVAENHFSLIRPPNIVPGLLFLWFGCKIISSLLCLVGGFFCVCVLVFFNNIYLMPDKNTTML